MSDTERYGAATKRRQTDSDRCSSDPRHLLTRLEHIAAKEAGVSNGSVFTSVDTKADLHTRLYDELKEEIARGPFESAVPWSRWSVFFPEKHTLAQLALSDAIALEAHQAGAAAFIGIRDKGELAYAGYSRPS